MFAKHVAAMSGALLSALAIAAAGAGTAGAAGTAAPTWGPLQPYQTLGVVGLHSRLLYLNSITCTSLGNCVAAGSSSDPTTNPMTSQPAVAVESGGTWGQPVLAPPVGTPAEFSSVACTSATSCVAVGTIAQSGGAMQAMAVSFAVSGTSATLGGVQTVALPADGAGQASLLNGVSCSSTCTAVGSYQSTYTENFIAMAATPGASGSWTAQAISSPAASPDSVLNAISCPPSGACEAVGTYGDGPSSASPGNLHSWMVPLSGGIAGTGQTVTVPGSDSTPASGYGPVGGLLGIPKGLSGVSCPSAGACTIVGSFTFSGTGEAAAAPVTQGTLGSFTTLSGIAVAAGISCPDAGDCAAVGVDGVDLSKVISAVAANEVGGAWSAATTLQKPSSLPAGGPTNVADAAGVDCLAPGICALTGSEVSSSGTGTTEIGAAGALFAYSATPPAVTTTVLPAAKVGVPYQATLTSSGDVGPASWSVTSGSLPAGLQLNAGTGVISGTPTTGGQAAFTITDTDVLPPSLSSSASLSIAVAAATTSSVPALPKIKLTRVTIVGHTASLRLSCSGARCVGKLKVTYTAHKHTITIASGKYSLTTGSTRTIKVKLNHRGLALLHRLGKLTGKLTLTPTGAKKPAVTRTLKFKS